MTTPLGRKIIDIIRHNGPMPVADYFALCLADPQYGYYRTRDPFGPQGDFVTAPEISQLFGEIIGIFIILAWRAHGRPGAVRLVELGPGRGTLMADLQRTVADLEPDMAAATDFHLVETSARLRDIQKAALEPLGQRNRWHERLEDVPEGLTLLVANEFFDALPMRQFVMTPDGFRERVVTVSDQGELTFSNGPATLDPRAAPPQQAGIGAILEVSPAREAVMATVTERLRRHDGAALVIDYGHLATAFGDTLQAMRDHRYEDVLASPGEADLTSHVDFEALVRVALRQGAAIAAPLTQARFLLGLGLLERAGALGHGKASATQDAIRQAVNRLAGDAEHQMGKLFKVLYVSAQPHWLTPFETAD